MFDKRKYLLLILILLATWDLSAQETGDTTDIPSVPPPLYESEFDPYRFEIGRIEILGNEAFSDEMILQYVTQRPTTTGVLQDVIIMYHDIAHANPKTPELYENLLDSIYKEMDIDYGFFSETASEIDVESIETFYQIKGRHEAEVSYYFIADTVEEENVLVFDIKEGPQYTLDTVVYMNIGYIDTLITQRIQEVRDLPKGMDYDEDKVLAEIAEVNKVLQDNGYYTVDIDKPDVVRDSVNLTDSVIVFIRLGQRITVGEIFHNHKLNGQRPVTDNLIDQMLEIEEGQYYNKSAFDRSINNLMSLQVFDLITIDTIQPQGYNYSDTVVPFLVQVSYRPQNEISPEIGLIQKEEGYKFLNLRFQASYENKNIFNAAQNLRTGVTADIRDLQRYINSGFDANAFEWEGQLNFFNYYQPLLYKFDETRLGLNASFNLSVRNAGNVYQINTWFFNTKLPVDFSSDSWVENLTTEITIEKQIPLNLQEELNNNRPKDPRYNFAYFEAAEIYNETNEISPTAFVFSNSIYHDTRNDLFDPTSGMQFSALADVTPGTSFSLAEFLKLQLSVNNFWDIGWGSVLATKARLGHIFFFTDGNTYISPTRQFFAGGPNSNRGWDPRRLRADIVSKEELEGPDGEITDQQYNFFKDFVGNASIIETSIEYRYRFHSLKNLPPAYSSILENIGLVAFADIGNSYGWLVDNEVRALDFSYILENLAIATGLGIRYFTPLGPVRLDVGIPIYGPIEKEQQWINEVPVFDYVQFNLGLQHAF